MDDLTCFRTMQALQLVSFHKDGRVQLSEDILRKIFLSEAAKDRDVAVISVAGAFRRGKSFLLNFFIRYLRAKVAVVLLDTQGTFDQNASMKENTAIVAISALLSSVQIFNYHERLDSQDLMNFEFFLEYGKLVQENRGKSQNIKIFQDIVFLIRDWNFADENPYGFEGGRDYFKNFFNPCVDIEGVTVNSDLVSVRQMLENCFDEVKCFLMPHPGDEVGGGREFKGQLKGQVTPKQVDGIIVTGSQLLEHVRAYVDTFNNSKDLPKPQTLFNIFTEEILRGLVKKAQDLYLSMMHNQTKEVTDIQQLRQFHDNCSENALNCFDQGQKHGAESRVKNSRIFLIEQITDEFHNFEERVQHRAQYASLHAQLNQQKMQNEELRKDIDSLRKTNAEQQGRLDDQKSKINELQNRNEDFERNIRDQNEKISDLLGRIKSLVNANEEQKLENERKRYLLNKAQDFEPVWTFWTKILGGRREQVQPKPQPSKEEKKKELCTIL
ncbi:hypothetical protein B566_EDAN004278 [Ephemera danica]|nr:hypothetical protein B566_EDAN004278 [Ephemera danica]